MTHPPAEYSAIAKTLHWTIAALAAALLALGPVMTRVDGWQLKFQLYQLHKSLGVTLLALMLLRLAWRVARKPPPLPPMPAWERAAAHGTHIALYLLLFALPLSGWTMVSAATLGLPTLLYGTVPWPHISFLAELPLEQKKTVEPLLKNVHAALGWALLALVVLHIAAALRHGLILKDGVMSRMLPRFLKSARFIKSLAFIATSLALAATSVPRAEAQEWALDKANSRITFEASAGGQPVTGEFKHFQTDIRFDPDEPKEAEIAASIEINSISTGRSDADTALVAPEWFDTQNYPMATLRGVALKEVDDNHYELTANLTIKGVTKRLVLPLQIDIKDGEAIVRTEASLDRLDFKVGPSEAIAGMLVDNNVRITVVLSAKRLDN